MTRWIVYAAAGLIAFLAFAAASLPARVVFDIAARPAGAQAGLVTGPVWNASLRRVEAAGFEAAAMQARLNALPLLSGRAVIDWTLADPAMRGAGRAVMPMGGGVILEAAAGVLSLDAVDALAAADLSPGQSARIEIDRLALGPDGACREARGKVTSTALAAAGERYGAALPALNAQLMCAGDAVALDFRGDTETLALSGRLRLMASEPQWRIVAEPGDRDVIAALTLMGFDQEGDRFVAESAP
ncbi:MAG: type II secretion system protein N [Oceanicaulis sp.]